MFKAYTTGLRPRFSSKLPRNSGLQAGEDVNGGIMDLITLFMIVFVPYSLWMWLTTKDQREMIFGYLLLFSVIAYIARLFLGEGSSIDF